MKYRIITHRLNGHNKGDIVTFTDSNVIEYLINSGQIELAATETVTTDEPKPARTKLKKRKD
jgi:hypothetical protein